VRPGIAIAPNVSLSRIGPSIALFAGLRWPQSAALQENLVMHFPARHLSRSAAQLAALPIVLLALFSVTSCFNFRKSTTTPVAVATVTVAPPSASVLVGGTVALTATPADATGNVLKERAVNWTSDNASVATVNTAGLVTAVAPGSATITATSEGMSGNSAITVTSVAVASLSVSPASATINSGATRQLTATPKDSNGNTLSGRVVTWSSDNTAAATVNSSGLVRGVAAGTANITASCEGQTGSSAITVIVVPVASVAVSPSSATIGVGATQQLSATPKDAGGNSLTGRTVTWSSDNTAAATVSSSGLVGGVAAGSATITATCEGKSGTCAITVSATTTTYVLVGAGDIAVGGGAQDQTAALINTIPGTVFAAGDNAYEDGTLSQYQAYYDPTWGQFKSRTRPCPGNHEYHTANAAGYFGYFGALAGPSGQGYYSYDLGDWHIISLDSEIPMSAGSAQEVWLKADLAASSSQCTIAYWHRPRYNSGDIHGDQSDTQPLWKDLSDAGAEIVICGHEHVYERYEPMDVNGNASPTGIREFVVGTGGANLYSITTPSPHLQAWDTSTYGVLKLTLGAGTYSWEFIPIAGQTYTDSGSGVCHK
jgi:uncharacterized protein YjdB